MNTLPDMNSLPKLSYSIVEDCTDAIIATTLTGTIVAWNNAAEQLFGYSAKEAIGNSGLTLPGPAETAEEAEVLEQVRKGARISALNTLRRHKNGRKLMVSVTLSPLKNDDGQVIGVASIVRPSAKLLQKQQELMVLAYHDSLTGLSNRAHLLDRLEQAMRRDERNNFYGAVLFIDLDDFKHVNDTAGHLTGDRILVRAARRMEAKLRKSDTIARWGGDEFVILIEDLDRDFATAMTKACAITKKVITSLSTVYQFEGHSYSCPPSVGVAFFRGVTQPIMKVIEHADLAMYQAKADDKSRFHISDIKPDEMPKSARGVSVAA